MRLGNPSQGFSLAIAVGSGRVPLALAVFSWLLLIESRVRIHTVVGIEPMLFIF